jgi:hypothetical protein
MILVPKKPLPELAQDTPPQITLTREERDRIAHLAVLIAQAENRRGGDLTIQVPYEERTDEQKAAARLSVIRILQAMMMLGYLEP